MRFKRSQSGELAKIALRRSRSAVLLNSSLGSQDASRLAVEYVVPDRSDLVEVPARVNSARMEIERVGSN